MAKNIIVINVDLRETRVALIQDGVIAELHIERSAQRGTVGNVVLGKVTRVLPGMQAAFIDVGQDRAAFLHVEDLIRPKDFDAYLAANSKALALATGGEPAPEGGEDASEAAAGGTSADGETASRELTDRGRSRRKRRSRRNRGGRRGTGDEASAEGLGGDEASAALPKGVYDDGDDEREEGEGDTEETLDEVGQDDGDAEEAEDREDTDEAEDSEDDEFEDLSEYDEPDGRGSLGLSELLDLDEDDLPRSRLSDLEEAEDDEDEDDDDDAPESDEAPDYEDDVSDGPESDEPTEDSVSDDDYADDDLDEEDEDEELQPRDELDDDDYDDLEDDEYPDEDAQTIDAADEVESDDLEEESSDEDTDDADEDTDDAEDTDDDREDDADEDTDADADEDDAAGGDDEPRDVAEGSDDATEPSLRRRRTRAPRAAESSAETAAADGEASADTETAEEPPTRYRRRRRRRSRGGAATARVDEVRSEEPAAAERSDAERSEGEGVGDDADAPRARRRRGRRRRRGSGEAEVARPRAAAKTAAPVDPTKVPARVSRSVPITEVVREGDEVVVQISKEPIGTKGARVTSHVSLPGRYVVYLPTVEHTGISKRIGQGRERSRLRKVIDALKPPTGGLIVRTVAEGLTKKQLKADVGYLIRVWADIAERRKNARARDVLYEELDLVLKVARDYFTDEVVEVIIDDRDQYARLVRFVEMFMPGRVSDIKLYTGDEPIFDAYGIEDEIKRALSRKVPLPSGGSLIMDQAEALTAIDVNTGRYVGKGSKDLEETALKTNLEAVDEIAQQLRFRNIGGLVILDLIDMERAENRDKVWRALEKRLAKDKAKTTINRISELGLIEMTRKRTRESLGRIMHESCFYCDGTGHIQSRETIAYEILRQIRRERHTLPGYSVRVSAHPAVVDFLKFDAKDAVVEAERRYLRRIELVAKQEYHIEQYDLQGR